VSTGPVPWCPIPPVFQAARRNTATGHQARLDEILIHNGEELEGEWEERRARGHSYVLRTAHPGAVEYDHGTLYADVTSQLIQQPRKAKKSKEVKRVDRKKLEEEAEEWAIRVRSRGLETSKGRGSEAREEKGMIPLTEEEVRGELKRWIAIARAELPRKEMHIGGEKARRKGIHYSKEQALLTRQVKELERELIRSNSKTQGDDRVERGKQIAQWIGGSGEEDIALPERWDAEGRRKWIGIVNR